MADHGIDGAIDQGGFDEGPDGVVDEDDVILLTVERAESVADGILAVVSPFNDDDFLAEIVVGDLLGNAFSLLRADCNNRCGRRAGRRRRHGGRESGWACRRFERNCLGEGGAMPPAAIRVPIPAAGRIQKTRISNGVYHKRA